MLNSPAEGTSVFLPLGSVSLVQPLMEVLFLNHANGPGSPPAQVPSAGLFNIFGSGPSLLYFNAYFSWEISSEDTKDFILKLWKLWVMNNAK